MRLFPAFLLIAMLCAPAHAQSTGDEELSLNAFVGDWSRHGVFLSVADEAVVLERGDCIHVDFGLNYMGFSTDWQKHAYLLKPGEKDAPEGLKRALRLQVAAFPDVHYTIEALIAEGDRVVLHNTWRATHRGEYLGFPPTGKRIAVTAMHLLRLQDGLIVEHWGIQDRLGLVEQLRGQD